MNRRGFSLIEVLISVAILAFVIAGISMILIKQSQASVVQMGQRDLEESGRLALLDLARAARLAGYGIAPTAAFDFDRFACTTPGTASTCPNGGRDRSDGPDEMVVAWRDPLFARAPANVSVTTPYAATFTTGLTQPLKAGRIVQAVCAGGDTAAFLALATDAAVGAVNLSLRVLTAADGYFPTAPPAGNCFATASLYLVERIRYYIANDPTGVPSLYRDRGRGTQELLYRGIEDLQVTYDIGQPPAGSPFAPGGATPAPAPGCLNGGVPTWSFGSCPGVVGTPIETAAAPIWTTDPYDSQNRYTGNPANIRNVNVFVVARATRESPDGTGDSVPAIANRPARAVDKYRRAVISVSEQPINLLARGYFLALNTGGG